MDEDRRAGFRQDLLAERARLLQEDLTPPPRRLARTTYGSQAAVASEVFAQQRDLALRDRSTPTARGRRAALVRLDEGTFGTCRVVWPSRSPRSGSRLGPGRRCASTASASRIADRPGRGGAARIAR